jgi:hypothetical protein
VNSRYQKWLEHCFNHEVKDPLWYFETEALEFEAPPAEIIELIGRTFRLSGKDLKAFTDAQVDQGLWYIASSSGSNFMHKMELSEIPLEKRLQSIGEIFHLYSECFAERCAETFGHLSEEGSPLNSSCYMFWDICPLTCSEDVKIQDSVLNVLRRTLSIEHRACREGALHGLGEMTHKCPEKVRKIIGDFLSGTKLDDKLLAYALNAREGNIP